MQSWSARAALPVTSQKLFKTRQRKGSWAETDIWKEKPKIYLFPQSDLPYHPLPSILLSIPPPSPFYDIWYRGYDLKVFFSFYIFNTIINKQEEGDTTYPPPSTINKQGVGKPPPPLYLRVFGNEWKKESLDINIEISEYLVR